MAIKRAISDKSLRKKSAPKKKSSVNVKRLLNKNVLMPILAPDKKKEVKNKTALSKKRRFRKRVSGDPLPGSVDAPLRGVHTPKATWRPAVELVQPQHIISATEHTANLVTGELYSSLFAFNIETPQVQVDPQVWDTVMDNLPDRYMIPDPAFMNALTEGMNPVTVPNHPADKDESTGESLYDTNFIAALSDQIGRED